jgi:hypothetical protein
MAKKCLVVPINFSQKFDLKYSYKDLRELVSPYFIRTRYYISFIQYGTEFPYLYLIKAVYLAQNYCKCSNNWPIPRRSVTNARKTRSAKQATIAISAAAID